MQSDFAMFGTYQMMDDVRSRSATARVAEPLFANVAHDNSRSIANSTVTTTVGGNSSRGNSFVIVFFGKLQITHSHTDCIDLAVRNRLRLQLFEAVQLKN